MTDLARASILHVDMDAFYASVELARAPWLRGRPVIVGGEGRSVVLAASYEARAFGVHSAMPMAAARKLCPAAVVIPPDHHRYHDISRGVMAIFAEVSDKVEQISVDEAFVDVAGARHRLGDAVTIAQSIRWQVAQSYGITCSVGIAVNKSVAKIASTRAKPDGLLLVEPQQTVAFLHALPVTALWGVGAKTAAALARWGITSIGELAAMEPRALRRAVGEAAAVHLLDLAWGRDPRPVAGRSAAKSLGGEVTFDRDLPKGEELQRVIRRLSDQCGARLRQAGQVAGVVMLKVRTEDFVTSSRSRTLATPTDVGHTIYRAAAALLRETDLQGKRVRLIGVRAEGLTDRSGTGLQASLFDDDAERHDVERAVDAARARFGAGAVGVASLISHPPASVRSPADLS